MLQLLHEFDVKITEIVANLFPNNQFYDALFSFLSLNGFSIIFWIIMILYLVYVRHKENRNFIPDFLISYISTSILVDLILKNIFQRPRPWVAQGLEETICPVNFSFPSGHASGAFAGATIFSTYDPKRSWLYYGIAVLIALSRVYLICHYVLDVIFGALIGYLSVKIILHLLSRSRKI